MQVNGASIIEVSEISCQASVDEPTGGYDDGGRIKCKITNISNETITLGLNTECYYYYNMSWTLTKSSDSIEIIETDKPASHEVQYYVYKMRPNAYITVDVVGDSYDNTLGSLHIKYYGETIAELNSYRSKLTYKDVTINEKAISPAQVGDLLRYVMRADNMPGGGGVEFATDADFFNAYLNTRWGE